MSSFDKDFNMVHIIWIAYSLHMPDNHCQVMHVFLSYFCVISDYVTLVNICSALYLIIDDDAN